MKNYYEILEVDKNASIEVIEKAYKTLAKKYHPDLQAEEEKRTAEEKMKLLNEAYEILSDEEKRKRYDEKITEKNKKEDQRKVENNSNFTNGQTKEREKEIELKMKMQEEIIRAKQQAYRDAYIKDLKQRGYRIKYKHGFKYYFEIFTGITISCVVLFLIYQIPPIKRYCIMLYNENDVLKFVVDIIGGLIKAIVDMF